MEIGAEISQKIRSAIKSKLMEVGAYVDDELPDYIMVMVANKKSQEQMTEDLSLFLGGNTDAFTSWLHNLLQKLQNITVEKPGLDLLGESESPKTSSATSTATKPTTATAASKPSVLPSSVPKSASVPSASTTQPVKAASTAAAASPPGTKPSKSGKKDKSSSTSRKSGSRKSGDVDKLEPEIHLRPEHDEFVQLEESVKVTEGRKSSSSSLRHSTSRDEKSHRDRKAQERSSKPPLKRPSSKEAKESGSKKRSLASSIGAVIRREEESSGDDLPVGSLASVVKVTERKSSIPPSLQANKSLLLKAVTEAHKSIELASRKIKPRSKTSSSHTERVSAKKRLGGAIKKPITSRLGIFQERRSEGEEDSGTEAKPVPLQGSAEETKLVPLHGRIVEIYTKKSKQRALKRAEVRSETDSEDDRSLTDSEEEEEVKPARAPGKAPAKKRKKAIKAAPVAQSGSEADEEEEEEGEKTGDVALVCDQRRVEHSEKPAAIVTTKRKVAHRGEDESLKRTLYKKPGLMSRSARAEALRQQQKKAVVKVVAVGDEEENLLDTMIPSDEEFDLESEEVDEQMSRAQEEGSKTSVSSPKFVVTLGGLDDQDMSHIWKKDMSVREDSVMVTDEPTEDVMVPDESEDLRRQLLQRPKQLASGKTVGVAFPVPMQIERIHPVRISLQDDEDSTDEYSTPMPPPPVPDTLPTVVAKFNERCHFWPACKNGTSCAYAHPNMPCRNFPNCMFGDKCLYVHPNCRFDTSCSRPGCPYTHTGRFGQAPTQAPPAAFPAATSKLPSDTVCRFFPKCTNMQCPYKHPKPCRFGVGCTMKATCMFSHPDLPSKEKLVWKPTAANSQTNLANELALSEAALVAKLRVDASTF